MRFQSLLLVILFLLFCVETKAQGSSRNSGDLENAKVIEVNKLYTFAESPVGFGKRQEFVLNKYRASIVFKEENNTIWFKMVTPYDGLLTFEITPVLLTDDYDWMLYRYNFRLPGDIKRDIARPVRSNISRNDPTIKSKTGLKEGFQNPYANSGPGKSFSKPLEVKKGDTLAIIIDNIYEKGSGFSFQSKLTPVYPLVAILKGRVFCSEDKKPLAGEILCEDDATGAVLSKAMANVRGEYSIAVPLNRAINVTAKHKGFIFKTEDVSMSEELKVLDFYLDAPVEGRKLILYNIHFSPDKDLILTNAEADLKRLTDFLKENREFSAKIIGHTNNNPFADNRYLQQLSFRRAVAIKKHLLANGVSESRLSCMGMGGKTPLVQSKDPKEGLKNLRVEVELALRKE